MDWGKVVVGMWVGFVGMMGKEDGEVWSGMERYMVEDRRLEKRGLRMEEMSRVLEDVEGKCVLG